MEVPKFISKNPGNFLFTSESVNEGHPDKLCDQISDAILDACLEQDPESKVACEACATSGFILVFGEIGTKAKVDYKQVVRDVVKDVGYTSEDIGLDVNKLEIVIKLQHQSPEIAQAVHIGKSKEEMGAGDQGFMFGYATDETPELLPLSYALALKLSRRMSYVRKNNILPYLRPDGKSQVTVEYEGHPVGHLVPKRVHTLLISTQHDPEVDLDVIRKGLMEEVVLKVVPHHLLDEHTKYLLNAGGSFVVGGPASDSGLTGRKIIVDTYGGWGAHGGGCFSGKDSTKVDRSATYYARYAAKSLVASGLCRRVMVQVSYGFGLVDPVSLNVNTYGTAARGYTDHDLELILARNFNFKVGYMTEELQLKRPIFRKTSVYGHFGTDDPNHLWEHPKDLSHELRLTELNGGERPAKKLKDNLTNGPQVVNGC